jgi:hypothetical protein
MFVKLSRYLPGNPLLQGSSNTKSTNIGMIIGLVMGGILALVIIICLVLFIQYKFQNIITKEMASTGGQMMKSVLGKRLTINIYVLCVIKYYIVITYWDLI